MKNLFQYLTSFRPGRALALAGALLATAAHAQTGALVKTASPQGDPSRPPAQARPLSATVTAYAPLGTRAKAQQRQQAMAVAATTTVTFANSQQGWFSPQQGHQAENDNYLVGGLTGYIDINGAYRNFFTFPLTGLNLTGKQVVSATLSLVDNGLGSNSTVTYVLHDVNTPAATLGGTYAAGDPVTASVFNDLGTGQAYGSYVGNSQATRGRRDYTLAQAALADIAARAGQNFTIGGMILEEQASTSNFLFGSTGNNTGQQILTLELADAQAITTGTVSPAACAGASLAVPFTAAGTFASGNVFSAQLSDAAGSFAAPATIGTLAGTSSGTIAATLPASTPAGTAYRIRVVSSDPTITGSDNGSNITINALPTATLSGDATICAGSRTDLSVALTGTGPWSITYTDGTTPVTVSATASPLLIPVTPATDQTYALTAVSDANCTGTSFTGAAAVVVNTRPVVTAPANQVLSSAADQCGASASFAATATGRPAAELVYTIGTTVITSPHMFPVGTTTVTATATNSCGSDAQSFTVQVQDRQAPVVRARNISVDLVNGIATARAEDLNSFSTDNCSGVLLYSVSPSTFTCANIGPNTVTFTVQDASGNRASVMATVTVRGSVPTPAIAVSPSPAVSPGGQPNTLYLGYGPQSLTLTASGGARYQWTLPTGLRNPTNASQVFTATTAGTFTYTVTATSASGCPATASVTLTVVEARCSSGKKLDKVMVCHSGTTLCISSADVADHVRHGDQVGNCPSGSTRSLTAALPALLEAYPNPFTAATTLRFRPAQAGAASLLVYNSLGQLVATLFEGVAEPGQVYERTLDGNNLTAGLYTCRFVVQGGESLTQRVVLTK
ncbi:T9SS type A sorting domain-containing protein [Hymenobacter sp.]|jgi:hypothetical protein|uniref:T9SS type A sorting domain-containing protein n=1 Tax=Hymenobacter sp. TaxID=1898978 RepID=UPI002ED7EF9C